MNNKDRAALDDRVHVDSIVRLALSLGPQRSLLETLKEVAEYGGNRSMSLWPFSKSRGVEVYSLGQIASERVAVVNRLHSLIDDRSLERSPYRPDDLARTARPTLRAHRDFLDRVYTMRLGRTVRIR
ncbi:hypothetical protein AB0M12_04975 [Nocardia vinacea]|uniref:hypothetical protein n=1 Tax=Nocardia vinacea TaxID=96468 RepID=UPI003423765F